MPRRSQGSWGALSKDQPRPCTEEQCELDTAVKELEGLTAELDRLSEAEKAEFRAFMLRETAAHPRAAVASEISQFANATFAEED
jgi:hypothetical protein